MNGGTATHARIERNILRELASRLEGSACEVFLGGTMKVRMGLAYRYPDGIVTCAGVAADAIAVELPVVLFEVVSPSSRTLDHTTKAIEYQSLPSLRRYVILEQDEQTLTVHVQTPGGWQVETLTAADTLALPELATSMPVSAFYKGVFPPD